MGNKPIYKDVEQSFVETNFETTVPRDLSQKKVCHKQLEIPTYVFTTEPTDQEPWLAVLRHRGLVQDENKNWYYPQDHGLKNIQVSVQICVTETELGEEEYKIQFYKRLRLHSTLQCSDELDERKHQTPVVPLLYDYFFLATPSQCAGYLILQQCEHSLIPTYVAQTQPEREALDKQILPRSIKQNL